MRKQTKTFSTLFQVCYLLICEVIRLLRSLVASSDFSLFMHSCVSNVPNFVFYIYTRFFNFIIQNIIVLQLAYNFNARLALRILRIPITWRVYSRRPSVGFCQRALRFIVPVLRPLGTSDGSPLRIRCVSPKYQLNALRTPTNRDTSAFTLFWTNSCAKLSYQHC